MILMSAGLELGSPKLKAKMMTTTNCPFKHNLIFFYIEVVNVIKLFEWKTRFCQK